MKKIDRIHERILGYTWSVYIAPELLRVIQDLQDYSSIQDPDIRWIIQTNLKK